MKNHFNRLNRRQFFQYAAVLIGTSNIFKYKAFLPQDSPYSFPHGVASGDPLSDRVMIWTRVTAVNNPTPTVKWVLAKDSNFRHIVGKGIVTTNTEKDFTVKIDVTGLQADTYYYYRFSYKGSTSVVGRTKTLPVGDIEVTRLIAVSCNAYEGGYFHAYRQIAQRAEKIDAVLHLGDYIYEDYLPQYFEIKARIPMPQKRCVSLSDYRTRYAQYRSDADLQAAHQMHPFINIWDDHEIANDAFADGAAGHNAAADGDFALRKQYALQCFLEWLPIRTTQLNCKRAFAFGNLVDLFMLDERTERSAEMGSNNPNFKDPNRTMISLEQFDWLTHGLQTAAQKWKIIGNQVLFSTVNTAVLQTPNANKNLDNWSGYPAQQSALTAFLKKNAIKNTLFVSGDSHCSWAFEVPDFSATADAPDAGTYAVEIGVPSISSSTWGDNQPSEKIDAWEQELLYANKHLKYTSVRHHGYVYLEINQSNVFVDWYAVDKRTPKVNEQILTKSMTINDGIAAIHAK